MLICNLNKTFLILIRILSENHLSSGQNVIWRLQVFQTFLKHCNLILVNDSVLTILIQIIRILNCIFVDCVFVGITLTWLQIDFSWSILHSFTWLRAHISHFEALDDKLSSFPQKISKSWPMLSEHYASTAKRLILRKEQHDGLTGIIREERKCVWWLYECMILQGGTTLDIIS